VAIKIVMPKPGETLKGIVRVVAEAEAPVEFSVDGELRATDRTAAWGFWWHTPRFPDGPHQVAATVEFPGGATETATVDVVVANAPAAATVPGTQPRPQVLPVRPPTIWDEDGVFINDLSAFSPHLHGEWAWAAGFRWIAPRIQDGVTVEASVGGSAALDPLRARGFKIVGWHVNRIDPEGEAAVLARQAQDLRLDGIIANAEYEYEFSANAPEFGGPEGGGERHGRSRRFLTALRALLPTTPVALSTFGRADRHDLHWAAWIQDGADFLPQAYPNVAEELEVGLCVSEAGKCLSEPPIGWTPDRVHPTINLTGEGSRPVTPAKYAQDLAASGAKGFSVYLGEVMTEDAYKALAPAANR
jgi:hypothetical protein